MPVNEVKLPQPYHRIARIIGVDATLKLARELGGERIYLPKLTTVTRDEEIRQRYDGYNIRELAREYGLSERWIRKIVNAQQ